jgi:hypothetical protein
MNDIIGFTGVRTFENTVKPISDLESDMDIASVPLGFYSSVAVSKDMR